MYKKACCTYKVVVLLIKVMLHDSQRRFLAQHSVATLLRHCFEYLQHCSNIATLCCAKNRRWESSRVTSPLNLLFFQTFSLPSKATRTTSYAKSHARGKPLLQGRMGRFSEWSSVSFNVTITNFFRTIERFEITLTSLQQTSHSD